MSAVTQPLTWPATHDGFTRRTGRSDLDISGGSAWPTLAEVLSLMDLRAADPVVITGKEQLGRRVRWVHVSELVDIASLLQGSELILTTGIALPATMPELRRYVATLCEAGATGLVLELGRRYIEAPPELVAACTLRNLPLIVLHREVPFVKVTEAIASLIIRGQDDALRAANEAHQVFTSLCIRGASCEEIVREVAKIGRCPVVFEDALHRVIAWDDGGAGTGDILTDWASRSRNAVTRRPTDVPDSEGWLVASVEAHSQVWGRLVIIPDSGPTASQRMLLERGATALALVQLLERNREALELQSQRSVLRDIIDQKYVSRQDILRRVETLGVPLAHRVAVAIQVDLPVDSMPAPRREHHRHRQVETMLALARDVGLEALACSLGESKVGIMACASSEADLAPLLQRFAIRVHDQYGEGNAVVSIGSYVSDVTQIARSFNEAGHVAGAAKSQAHRVLFKLPDTQLRGLLYILGADARLQSFVERTLGSLLELDARTGSQHLDTLRHYLQNSHNKSVAAERAHISRQSLYQRLSGIERILGVDLQSSETCASLYVAVLALDSAKDST
jgi:purine catabolism regulator